VLKILIIGSEGFIGHNCVTYFQQNGWDVYGCDLVDYPRATYNYTKLSRLQPSFDEIFSKTKFDACINTAGNGSVPVSIEHPLTDFDANCADVIKILDLIRLKNKDCKYIHLSSAAVYGNPQTLPIKESDELHPISPYGFHKQISELLCKEYYALYQIGIAIVRPFSIYGPGLRKQLFWDLYQKCKLKPTELVLWGTGNESRDFIYIADLVKTLNLILDRSPMAGQVYNLANGTETTIKQAAQVFLDSYDSSITLKFNGEQRIGDPINWRADVSQIQELGYLPKTSFAEGVGEYVNWLKSSNLN
jgi:UDP-glucose 4-epimerase